MPAQIGLTDTQVQFFEDEGYLVVEDVLDQKTVLDPVRAEYSALLDKLYDQWHANGKVPAPTGMSFDDKLLTAYRAKCEWFQPFDISLPGSRVEADTPFHFGPAVFNMLTAPKLLDVVQSLIGSEITSNPIQHVRIKPPVGDLQSDEVRAHITKTDWHQDQGVTLESADNTRMVTVWIAVSDATEKNGCLKVLPNSARTGPADELIPHCEKTQIGIPDSLIDERNAVPLPVGSGGVVLFNPLTPHASLVNNSSGLRWSFDVRYNVTGQSTGREHFPEFIARSASNPKTEFNDPIAWQAMWEDTRARLAAAEHISLYRWDASAPFCA